MNPIHPDDPVTKSAEPIAENIAALQALFPEAFTEGRIDFEVLKQLLGGNVEEREEKYGLNWHGKRKARQMALSPSTGTLRPCPEESVDWDTTQNLMIEGDNLEVLKLLQKSYAGKVKLIYIDPPYNTGKDFVYPDDFQDNIKNYLELTGQVDSEGRKIGTNSEASGRFHTDWLNMMLPRLKLARNLLREDGIIAISIDDNEIDHVDELCAEVFGEENFLAAVSVLSNPRGRQSDSFFATVHEYLVVFARNVEECAIGGATLTADQRAEFDLADDDGASYRLLGLRQRGAASLREDRPDMYFPIYVNPDNREVSLDQRSGFTEKVLPRKSTGQDGRWMWGSDKCRRDIGLLVARLIDRRGEYDIFVKDFLERDGAERSRKLKSIWDDKRFNNQNGTQEVKALLDSPAMSFPKPLELLKNIVKLGTESSEPDIVLDFFAGSGTTGHGVLACNCDDSGGRRYILVQLPEPLSADNKEQRAAVEFCDKNGKPRFISELTKERLRRAAKKVAKENPLFHGDLGFRVFKLATSNIAAWSPNRTAIAESLQANADHLKLDRTEQDILYELLLKRGLDLCVPIETRSIAGKQIHSIGAGVLMACLATQISREDVEPLAHGMVAWRKQLNPAGEAQVIFRDSAFADDVAKSNLTQILCQYGFAEKSIRSI